MADPKIKYDIAASVKGVADVQKLAGELDKLADTLEGDLKQEAVQTAAALRKLTGNTSAMSAFEKQKQVVQDAANAYRKAKTHMQEVERQYSGLTNRTNRQTAAMTSARTAVARTGQAYINSTRQLRGLRTSLHKTGISTRQFATASGALNASLRQGQKDFARLKQAADRTKKSVDAQKSSYQGLGNQLTSLRNQLVAVAGIDVGAGMLRDAVATADAYKNLRARISLVAGEGEALEEAYAKVRETALSTHAPLESTGMLMTRIARAGKNAGLSTKESLDQALDLTTTISQAIQVSGASAAAADAAITQLMQGLQSGVLRGEEFNSVMEQTPRLARALADGLKVNTGELRRMAMEGKLTTDVVIKSLKSQSETVQEEFGKLPPTVGRALQDLDTNWTDYIGKTDTAKGATAEIASAINVLANNLETVAGTLFSVGKAYAAYKALGIAKEFYKSAQQAAAAATANKQNAVSAQQSATANTQVARTANTAAVAQRNMAASGTQLAASNRAAATTARMSAAANTQVTQSAGIAARAKQAFANTSTKALGAVSGGVTKLIGVLASLKTFGAVAILSNAPEIGRGLADLAAGFTGVRWEALKAEQELYLMTQSLKHRAELEAHYQKLLQSSIDKVNQVSAKARAMADSFNTLTKSGKSTNEALNEIQKTLDTSDYTSLYNFSSALLELQRTSKLTADEVEDRWKSILTGKAFEVDSAAGIATTAKIFDELERKGVASAETIQAAWSKALNGQNLLFFEMQAKQAFAEGAISAQQLEMALDQSLRAAVERAGLSFEAISGGMNAAEKMALNNIDVLIDGLDRMKAQGIDTGLALSASIGDALKKSGSKQAIESVIAQIQRLRNELGQKVTDGLLDQAAEKLKQIGDASDDAKGGINSVREAMRKLGVTSKAELQQTAKEATEAYNLIKNSGQATSQELAKAWKKQAEAQIAANDGVATATLKAQAQMHDLAIEADKTGKAVVRSMSQAAGAVGQVGSAAQSAKRAVDDLHRGSSGGKFAIIGDDENDKKDSESTFLAVSGASKSRAETPTEQANKGKAPNWSTAAAPKAITPDSPPLTTKEQTTNRTYKIKIGGAGTLFTDAQGAQTVDRLMRTLEQGKNATGRSL